MYKYYVIDNRICILKSLALNASLTFRLVAWWPQNFCTALPPPPEDAGHQAAIRTSLARCESFRASC